MWIERERVMMHVSREINQNYKVGVGHEVFFFFFLLLDVDNSKFCYLFIYLIFIFITF